MKRFAIVMIAGTMIFGAACSNEPKSAEDKYNAFIEKYEPAMKDLQDSLGGSSETFDQYVTGEGCEPIDDESVGLMTLILGPVLSGHGLSVSDFVKDFREVHEAIKSEGLCNSVKTTASTNVTTTTEPSEEDSSECKEAERVFQDYVFNNSEQDPDTFSRLLEAANAACV